MIFLFKLLQATSYIVASALGAGILAFPVVTAYGGYFPSLFWSVAVAISLGATATLLAGRAIRMGGDAHISSLCRQALGERFERFVIGVIACHYGILMIAYCSVGAQVVRDLGGSLFRVSGGEGLIYPALIAALILMRPKGFFSLNFALTALMGAAYSGMIRIGWPCVEFERLLPGQFWASTWTLPIFFSAFGFHSLIPSVCRFCRGDRALIYSAIWLGVFFIWLVVMVWQTLVMGSVSNEQLLALLKSGEPATVALSRLTQSPNLGLSANLFALLAIVTSHAGVLFALGDLAADITARAKLWWWRRTLMLALLALPLGGSLLVPGVFETALTISGGLGCAILNGILPVCLSLDFQRLNRASNWYKFALALFAIAVMGIEIGNLLARRF